MIFCKIFLLSFLFPYFHGFSFVKMGIKPSSLKSKLHSSLKSKLNNFDHNEEFTYNKTLQVSQPFIKHLSDFHNSKRFSNLGNANANANANTNAIYLASMKDSEFDDDEKEFEFFLKNIRNGNLREKNETNLFQSNLFSNIKKAQKEINNALLEAEEALKQAEIEEFDKTKKGIFEKEKEKEKSKLFKQPSTGIHIIFRGVPPPQLQDNTYENDDDSETPDYYFRRNNQNSKKKSENFEVIRGSSWSFNDVGGYDNVKTELLQCVDILKNYKKYSKYNVRIPKGLILEGPPGNGKTLLAKAFAGECNVGFISVSGSEFQDKYVGVGSSRVRELFNLASKNVPCIIFIDEIDAIGRSRSSDGESSSAERDNTLNELLVALDGFKNNTGIFLIGATNRADLLDKALLRPGRIDKRIFIGLPDEKTREHILNIHISGKPYDSSVILNNMVDYTAGLSGAQIENLLNEAMLNALRFNRESFNSEDIDLVLNKMMAGWQPNEHQFSDTILDKILVHEMGHAVVGFLSSNHPKLRKIVINLFSPNTPGYTLFEAEKSSIHTRDGLLEHLSVLLAGRLAEELFYGVGSVSNGALNDFEEALKLAQKMVMYYGMGTQLIYPSYSEKYKEMIDNDVIQLIKTASLISYNILTENKNVIERGAKILKKDGILDYKGLKDLYGGDVRS